MGGERTYNLEFFKVRVNVAVSTEGRYRSTPARRVGAALANVRGDARAWEEPDFDGVASPLGGVHAAADFVESISIGLGVLANDSAARVGGLVGCLDVAVTRIDRATEARIID